jgi:hypothetical protein
VLSADYKREVFSRRYRRKFAFHESGVQNKMGYISSPFYFICTLQTATGRTDGYEV